MIFAGLVLSVRCDKLGFASGVPVGPQKAELRKQQPDFSEKKSGYRSFLQFCKAAAARGVIEMELDEGAEDYLLRVGEPTAKG